VLRACRRVLKPGGRIAYFNIFIAEHLPDEARRRIAKAGNPSVYSRSEQLGLLRSAGFVNIEATDVTDEYLRVQRAVYEANERHARALRRVQGPGVFEERQRNRSRTLENIEAGVLRRSLFVAERARRRT
jgi:hypothetical protein